MVPDAGSVSTQLVGPREEAAEARLRSALPELQRTCLGVLRAQWSKLAVVAMGPRAPAWRVATALAEAAHACRLPTVRALNGEGAAAAQVTHLLELLQGAHGSDVRTVVAVDDPLGSPERMPLVVAADAVLLIIQLGASKTSSVEAMADLVGRERIVGCVVLSR